MKMVPKHNITVKNSTAIAFKANKEYPVIMEDRNGFGVINEAGFAIYLDPEECKRLEIEIVE